MAKQCREKMDSEEKERMRKGGADREHSKRRKALVQSVAKSCKIPDMFRSKGHG